MTVYVPVLQARQAEFIALGKMDLLAVPASYVYDRKGELRKRFDNNKANTPPFTYDDVDKLVAELVAE